MKVDVIHLSGKQKCLESKRARLSAEQISLHKTCALRREVRFGPVDGCSLWRVTTRAPGERATDGSCEPWQKGMTLWNTCSVFSADLKIHVPSCGRRRETLWHLNSAGHLSAPLELWETDGRVSVSSSFGASLLLAPETTLSAHQWGCHLSYF